MSKVALIVMALPKDAPYLSYYTQIFDQKSVKYDFIIWERDGKSCTVPPNYHVFRKRSPQNLPPYQKIYDMFEFSNFAKRIIERYRYDKLIVFTIQTAIFLQRILKNYSQRYILDIRDYSPILKLPFAKVLLTRLAHNSNSVVLSSPAFERFLDYKQDFYICHNINYQLLQDIKYDAFKFHNPIRILTIGQIRDKETNTQLMLRLANNPNFELFFSGKGAALPNIEESSKLHKVKNVFFSGEYNKTEELAIVNQCDLINSFLPDNLNSQLLLSNRLYISAVLGKPIIVNANSFQGEIVSKFNLGICINNLDGLSQSIHNYLNNYNDLVYANGRKAFLDYIATDLSKFKAMVISFINNKSFK